MRTLLLSTAIALAFLPLQGSATTIIAVWTPTSITIGADSREGNQTKSDAVCKITISNNTFWTWSGISRDSITGFNLDQVIINSMKGNGTLDERISIFESAIIPQIIKILKIYRINNPRWEENEGMVEAVFGNYEDDIIRIHAINLAPITDSLGNITINATNFSCPSPKCQDMAYVSMGQHKLIDEEITNDPMIWSKLGVPMAIHHFIESEIAALPDHVAPPIAMVEITKAGPRWISRGVCADSN